MDSILVPVSVGELFDKISILEIKKDKITNFAKLENINKELNLLKDVALKIKINSNNQRELKEAVSNLKYINSQLWDIEEKKRDKEKQKVFDQEFIELARLVYIKNDVRADIKRKINLLLNSRIIEEKSYEKSSSYT